MTGRVQVHVSAEDKRRWTEAAKRERLSLSRWVVQTLVVKTETMAITSHLARTRDCGSLVFETMRDLAAYSKPLKLQNIALHEAAHACAATALGLTIASVTIIPDSANLGRMDYPSGYKYQQQREQKEEALLIVDLAGFVAEARFDEDEALSGFSGDYENALEQARELSASPKQAVRRLKLAAVQAEELVEIHWPAIRRVAKALIARKRLTGAQVRAIFAGKLNLS